MVTLKQLFTLIFVTIAGIVVSYLSDIPLAVGFLPGLFLLLYLAVKVGTDKKAITQGMKNGAWRTKDVVLILFFVGILIPAWVASGTIPYMVELGLSLLNSTYFLTSAFILTAVISMILGTSVGSLSTVGIPLIGVGSVLHIPAACTAGALISGAFVGDRTSPLSSANQLVASSTGISRSEHGKALMPTTITALAVSIIFFLSLDMLGGWHSAKAAHSSSSLHSIFLFHPIVYLPPILLIGSIIGRVKTKYAFLLGILSGVLVAIFLQHVPPIHMVHYLVYGYDASTISVLHSKGLVDMLSLMIFIALTGAFNGILEETGIIQPYIKKVVGTTRNLAASTLRVCLFGLGLNFLSCNQTLPIMISGRNVLPVWSAQYKPNQLARIIADSSLIFAGLVPWNMLAILCSTIVGVPVISYLPFAVFLWILPIATLLVSWYKGKRERKSKVSEEDYTLHN